MYFAAEIHHADKTPTAFHHPAQGWCDEGAPTLGFKKKRPNPERVESPVLIDDRLIQPFQGWTPILSNPGVARSSQPRAERLNAVGVSPSITAPKAHGAFYQAHVLLRR